MTDDVLKQRARAVLADTYEAEGKRREAEGFRPFGSWLTQVADQLRAGSCQGDTAIDAMVAFAQMALADDPKPIVGNSQFDPVAGPLKLTDSMRVPEDRYVHLLQALDDNGRLWCELKKGRSILIDIQDDPDEPADDQKMLWMGVEEAERLRDWLTAAISIMRGRPIPGLTR